MNNMNNVGKIKLKLNKEVISFLSNDGLNRMNGGGTSGQPCENIFYKQENGNQQADFSIYNCQIANEFYNEGGEGDFKNTNIGCPILNIDDKLPKIGESADIGFCYWEDDDAMRYYPGDFCIEKPDRERDEGEFRP
jgi:hypothetical protein